MKVLLSTVLLVLALCQCGWTQHVREQDITFRITIVRAIDLTNSSNQKIFGKKALMSRILIEAAQSGACKVYHPDTLDKVLSLEEIKERLCPCLLKMK